MRTFVGKLPDIIILSAASTSNVIKTHGVHEDALIVSLVGPAALDSDTFVIEVADIYDPLNPSTTNWSVLQAGNPDADVTPPGALKAKSYFELSSFAAFRIKDQSGNVAADRTWKAYKQALS